MTTQKASPAPSASEFYLQHSTQFPKYDSKYRTGKNLLDHYIENELIHAVFTQYVDTPHDVLEIGAYSGRITKKLASYTEHITVSDTSADLLKHFHYPTLVLDLTTNPDDLDDAHTYDLIISIGQQVSLCGDISNAIAIFDRLLTADGILVFDTWNESLPARYDPPYPIEKASRLRVQELLGNKGFVLMEYRSGCRIPYVFRKAFSLFFRRSRNRTLFSLLLALEKRLFRSGLFDGREQIQFFIATRSSDASTQSSA